LVALCHCQKIEAANVKTILHLTKYSVKYIVLYVELVAVVCWGKGKCAALGWLCVLACSSFALAAAWGTMFVSLFFSCSVVKIGLPITAVRLKTAIQINNPLEFTPFFDI
jgi:hypothetical protein